jgi:hypothetical protein
LVIDPRTRAVSYLGDFGALRFKWRVGLIGPDNKIYGIPLNHDSVLVIDTERGSVDLLPCGETGHMKWNGGVVGVDGRIYGIPANARTVLVIDVTKQSTYLLGDLGKGSKKWRNGVAAPDGTIYGIPFDDRSVLMIDPKAQSVSRLGDVGAGTGKWADGALGDDGKIYGVPQEASAVLVVDPARRNVSLFGCTDDVGVADDVDSRMCGKWIECFKASTGDIFGVPVHAGSILVISPNSSSAGDSELPRDDHKPTRHADTYQRWQKREYLVLSNTSTVGLHTPGEQGHPAGVRRRWAPKAIKNSSEMLTAEDVCETAQGA